jgi:casein kinase 1
MTEGEIVNEKYKLEAVLGSGGFGKVFRVKSLKNKKQYALKLDLKRKGQILTEAKILAEIQTAPGIPKLYDKGKTENFSYMVITLLGDNLSTMLKNCGGRFTLGTVANVGTQLLNRVEYLHSKGYIHRDLKPQQFLLDQLNTMIYLVDYGLAKKFLIAKNHIPFQTHCPRAGNSTFASLNNHMGIRQSRRDDLESISYMLIYMFKGKLPWQQKNKHNSFLKWQKVFILKASINIQDLCRDSPPEFFAFMDYCRMLKFEEKPDYDYLRGLLSAVAKRFNMMNSFDWIISPVVVEMQEPESGKKCDDAGQVVQDKKPTANRRSNRSKTGKEKTRDIFKTSIEDSKLQTHHTSKVMNIANTDFLNISKPRPRKLSNDVNSPRSRLKQKELSFVNLTYDEQSKGELMPSNRSQPRSNSEVISMVSQLQEDDESFTNSDAASQRSRENVYLSPGTVKRIHFFGIDEVDVLESMSESKVLFSKLDSPQSFKPHHRMYDSSIEIGSIVPIIDESELTPRNKKLPEIQNREILYKTPSRFGSSTYNKTLSKETAPIVEPSQDKCAIF